MTLADRVRAMHRDVRRGALGGRGPQSVQTSSGGIAMDTNEFLARLREAMKQAGITQSELARRLGVREATVSDWFRLGAVPSGATFLRLPEVLHEDGHWLLTGERRGPGALPGTAALGPAERAEVEALLARALAIVRGEG